MYLVGELPVPKSLLHHRVWLCCVINFGGVHSRYQATPATTLRLAPLGIEQIVSALRQSFYSLCTMRGQYSGVATFVKESAVQTCAAESGLIGKSASGICSEAAAAAIARLAFSPSLASGDMNWMMQCTLLGEMHNAQLFLIQMSFERNLKSGSTSEMPLCNAPGAGRIMVSAAAWIKMISWTTRTKAEPL